MRVAILTNEYVSEEANFDGGIANHLAKIALVLKEMGHEPIVFVGSTKSEKIFHQGVEVHRVSFKINWLYKLLDKLSRFQYQTLLNVLWESYYLRRKIIAIHKQEKIDFADKYGTYLLQGGIMSAAAYNETFKSE